MALEWGSRANCVKGNAYCRSRLRNQRAFAIASHFPANCVIWSTMAGVRNPIGRARMRKLHDAMTLREFDNGY